MTSDLSDELRVEDRGPIRLITLNRPEQRNAINGPLHRALAEVWQAIRYDTAAKVVILTGVGDAFSAGGDLDWLRTLHDNPLDQDLVMDESGAMMHAMLCFPLPVIAAVNGAAVGLGCTLATMCDIVLMADTAYLADPHVNVGLAANPNAAYWPFLCGTMRAKEYLLTGDRIPADTAVEIGLASRVIPRDHLLDEAIRLGDRLAAQPARALQDTKRSINAHLGLAWGGPAQVAMASERLSMGSREHGDFLNKAGR